MAANGHLGEVEIELEGKTYLMRPTVEGLVQIEASTSHSIMDLLRRFAERRFGFSDMTAVVTAGLRGAGTEVNDRRVAEMVFNSGLLKTAQPVTEMLTGVSLLGLPEEELLEGEDAAAETAEGGEGATPGKV